MEPLVIDGAFGEGGGQILRSALTLAVLTGREIRIEHIRASRPNPGLAAQHVTAVRAAAAICGAECHGAELGSMLLEFMPRSEAKSGQYAFDVGAAREGGSAGAATLVLQTIYLPLALATGQSTVSIRGGTHMAWSPSFDYAAEAWLPMLHVLGADARLTLNRWGWYPLGKGEIVAEISGSDMPGIRLRAVDLRERGALQQVRGHAVAANLPSHIPQRMADRARALLTDLPCTVNIVPERVSAACPGAGTFLTAVFERVCCGFDALGKVGKASEKVAEEAVEAFLNHLSSESALDAHLGDQILLPLAFADGPSTFTLEQITEHLRTNAWVIERFGAASVTIGRDARERHEVRVTPRS